MENTPMPMSGDHAEHMAHGGMQHGPAAPAISLQDVQNIAIERKVEPGYSITLPTTATGVFTIAVFADDPRNDATLHVDQYTGKVLADVRFEQYGAVARATEIGVMLHEGKMFGTLQPDCRAADLPDDSAQRGQRCGDLVEAPSARQVRRAAAAPRPAEMENRRGDHAGAGGDFSAGGRFAGAGLAAGSAAVVASGPPN